MTARLHGSDARVSMYSASLAQLVGHDSSWATRNQVAKLFQPLMRVRKVRARRPPSQYTRSRIPDVAAPELLDGGRLQLAQNLVEVAHSLVPNGRHVDAPRGFRGGDRGCELARPRHLGSRCLLASSTREVFEETLVLLVQPPFPVHLQLHVHVGDVHARRVPLIPFRGPVGGGQERAESLVLLLGPVANIGGLPEIVEHNASVLPAGREPPERPKLRRSQRRQRAGEAGRERGQRG